MKKKGRGNLSEVHSKQVINDVQKVTPERQAKEGKKRVKRKRNGCENKRKVESLRENPPWRENKVLRSWVTANRGKGRGRESERRRDKGRGRPVKGKKGRLRSHCVGVLVCLHKCFCLPGLGGLTKTWKGVRGGGKGEGVEEEAKGSGGGTGEDGGKREANS